MTESLWAFLATSAVVIVTPGPDTIIAIRSAALGGRPAGIAAAFGVAVGQIIWALTTSLGLLAVLLASEPAFEAVKLLGAGYLIWLGLRGVLRALNSYNAATPFASIDRALRLPTARAFRHGLLSDLGNPKMAAFFSAVLPQFASKGNGTFSALFLLGIAFASMTCIWLILYVIVITMMDDVLGRPRIRRSFEGVTGGILVLLGLRLFAVQRLQ